MFGCIVYEHVRKDKLEPQALKCIILGYPEGVKAYKLWCLEPRVRKCIVNRDVVFNENAMANLIDKGIKSNSELFTEKEEGTSAVEIEVEKNEDGQKEANGDIRASE